MVEEAIIQSGSWQIAQAGRTLTINGKPFEAHTKQLSERLFQVIYQDRSYDVFVHKVDPDHHTVELSLNGKRTTIKLRTRMEQLLKELGMEHTLVKRLDSLKAPMPGLIHSLSVNPGDQVQKGDPLVILEAMKMENIIKSPGDGVVKKIHVAPKDSVEKGELLISFE